MIKQRTFEWLELRRIKITATDAAAIMGIHPRKTAEQLFASKLSGEPEGITPSMQRGTDLEPLALAEFTRMTGIETQPAVIISESRPWQMASLDGIDFSGQQIVEVKCGGKKTHDMARNGSLPPHYMCQVQHQLSVTELSSGWYFSFDGKEGIVVKIERNEEFIQKMLVAEKEFWDRLMDHMIA